MCNKHGMFCLETFFIDCVLSFKMCSYLFMFHPVFSTRYWSVFPSCSSRYENAVIFLQFWSGQTACSPGQRVGGAFVELNLSLQGRTGWNPRGSFWNLRWSGPVWFVRWRSLLFRACRAVRPNCKPSQQTSLFSLWKTRKTCMYVQLWLWD